MVPERIVLECMKINIMVVFKNCTKKSKTLIMPYSSYTLYCLIFMADLQDRVLWGGLVVGAPAVPVFPLAPLAFLLGAQGLVRQESEWTPLVFHNYNFRYVIYFAN
jgi:hypothetical protein